MNIIFALKQDLMGIEKLFKGLCIYLGAQLDWYKARNTSHNLSDVILHYNNVLPYNPEGVLYLPTSGAYIYKIEQPMSVLISQSLKNEANFWKLPIEFLLAAVQQESCFSPGCFNPNHQLDIGTWKNRAKFEDFQKTDWGIAQFSGYQLPAICNLKYTDESKIIEACKAEALDYHWAISHLVDKYSGLCDHVREVALKYKQEVNAQIILRKMRPLADDQELIYFCAWLAYNAGLTGAEKQLEASAKKFIAAHPFHCLFWYRQFKELNILA